jgi:hypothetical protein
LISKLFKSRLLSILLIVTLILSCILATPVQATNSYPYTTASTEVSGALSYLRAQQGTDGKIGDFATSAWVVMAIKAVGEDPNSWKVSSEPSIVDYLSINAASATSVGDYSRMILAIAAAAKDPTNFGGKNFVSLLKATYDGIQIGDSTLLNDDFWGVMALIAAGEPAPSAAVQGSVSFISSHQNADGGWSWGTGQASDVDDTAAAIMALIAAGQSTGSASITNGLAYIKSTQMNNGGFESWGSTNSATDSWGIDSIAAAGQDSTSAGWKNGTGKDPIDDLVTFRNNDGSFNWASSNPSNKALMTSYAVTALLGVPFPVAVLSPHEPEEGTTVDVRIEGQSATIWSGTVRFNESTITDDEGNQHHLDQPTALGALDEASKAGDFPYVVQNTAYGLYVYSINGESPVGQAGWTYRVDYQSPMVGVTDFILDQTIPPDPPHQEILFAYSQWGQAPLKVEADNASPAVGETFTVTVTEYDDNTGTWSPADNATVHADQNYTTDALGQVAVTINSYETIKVYAEKSSCIRSNKLTLTAGTGNAQQNSSRQASLTASIIPAISFSINPASINFGNDLGPGDSSVPVTVTLTNTGAWKLRITAKVTDTAQNLYVDGLKIGGAKWDVFSTTVSRNASANCAANLTVPETYSLTGKQDGILIFWATDGR